MRRKIQAKFIRIKIFILLVLACAGVVVPHAMAVSDSIWKDGAVSRKAEEVKSYEDCQKVPNPIIRYYDGIVTKGIYNDCVTYGKSFSLMAGDGGIRFSNSSYFVPLEFASDSLIYDLRLIPGTNSAIAIGEIGNRTNVKSGIFLIKDLVSILKVAQMSEDGRVVKYQLSFDPAKNSPLDIFKDGSSYEVAPYNTDFDLSKDNKYFVGVMNYKYYIKVNLETAEAKVFHVPAIDADSLNGTDIIRASDDGRYVFAAGAIFDTEGCGDAPASLKFDSWGQFTSLTNPCKPISVGKISDIFEKGASIKPLGGDFTGDSSKIELWFESYVFPDKRVIKKVTYTSLSYKPSDISLKYLALGDSISSGEGDTALNPLTGKKYYRAYTDVEEDKAKSQPREKCHLSTRSYPYLLAGWMKLKMDSPKEWNSVACSGATTTDIYGDNNSTYMGQKKDEKTPRLEGHTYATSLKDIALNEMIPGRNLQVEFVKKYKPKVITLTGGANDIEFGNKIKNCVLNPLTCSWADSQKNTLGNLITGQYSGLVQLYQKLDKASEKKAKIYAIGYPLLINDVTPGYCGANVGLNNEEKKLVVQATKYMNQVIKAAAQKAGVTYIDIESSLQGGRLCDDGQMYITGLAMWDKSEQQESFHPNSYGHIKMAQAIKKAVNNTSLAYYDNCPTTTENICPNDSITAPPLPPEFGTEEKNVKEQKVASSTIQKTVASKVSVPNYSLEPGSKLKATLHSDPISLGTIGVAGNGGVWADLKIPSTVPAGYHTLILEGKTYSGEPITITQSVVVMGTNTADRDENGVEDTKQPCGLFMTASGKDADLDGIDDACDPQIDSTPQLYRIRVGDPARSYAGAPEKPNYIYVERNTRASAITKISGDHDPDGDGWAIVGASSGIAYSETTMPDTAPAANVRIVTMNNVPTPYVYFRDGRHGCVSYTPETLAVVKSGEVRKFKLGSTNNAYCRSAAPTEDMDSNNLPDNTQPLYAARKGDTTKNEDPNRLYLLRSFHAAEAQLGISDYNYGGTPAINPNLPINEWTIMATTQYSIPTTDNYNKLVILKDSSGKPLPTLLTKNKTTNQCNAYQPANTLGITEKTLTTRWLNKLTALPGGVGCE